MAAPFIHPIPPPRRSRALAAVSAEIVACRGCPLSRGRTHAVPGEGPCPSDIVLVGEAPGAREDETGRPFIGPSGKLLSQALAEVGIDRRRVFVTSVVKCRPDGNRTPRRAEIAACRRLLDTQLHRITPRIVVLMGKSASSARLGQRAKMDLAGLRGRVHEPDSEAESKASWRYLCTVHPAAALRFPNRHRAALLADLTMARELAVSG
jgi:DNA polymerase